jgi:hypothetical protein
MIHNIFSVYDNKAEAFLPPFVLPKHEMAIRTFADSINNPETQLFLHPADYTLFTLGTFDDELGKITYEKTSLHNGVELQRHAIENLVDDFKTQEQLKAVKS